MIDQKLERLGKYAEEGVNRLELLKSTYEKQNTDENENQNINIEISGKVKVPVFGRVSIKGQQLEKEESQLIKQAIRQEIKKKEY